MAGVRSLAMCTSRRALAGFLFLLAFLLAGPATAATPRQSQYGNPIATEQAPRTVTSSGQATQEGQGLPVTGLQLGLIVVVAVGVAATGIGIRRSGREPDA